MRRTYRSKKETGGLDPRDMIQNMDEKSSKFDAFYIQNIKHTKRELSCLGITDQHPVSNRVRKKKFVKRLKESEVTQASTSPTTFLTPDKSLRVNKVEDLFDQLLNSSVVHNSPKTNCLQQNSKKKIRKTYKIRNRDLIKRYNLSSTDSSGSDKENIVVNENQSPNESDLKLHDLLLEKKLRSPTQLEDSIEDVKNNLPLFIKLQCQQNLLTPKQKLSQQGYLDLSKSPLCSTPFHEKYRGQSIYKYSPIFVDIENKAKFETITEAINTHDTCSSKKQKNIKLNESLDYDNAPHYPDTVKEQETHRYSKEINNSVEIIDNHIKESEDIDLETISIQNTGKYDGANIKRTSISKDISDVQDATTHNADMFDNNNQSLEASTIQVPDRQSLVQDSSIILQTSECTKFLGFSKSNGNTEDTLNKYRDLNNKLIDECSMTFTDNELASEPFIDYNNGSINSEHHTKSDILDMPSEPFMHCTYINSSRNSDANGLLKSKTSQDSDELYKVESISLYDTCSENDSMESSKPITSREPKVRIERLNKSVFQKYYKQLLCNTESDLSVTSDSSVNYESFDNMSVSVVNEENSDDGSDQSKIEPLVFVSTKRGNEITNDSFLINLDSFSSSDSSLEVDKTVVNNDEKVEKNEHKSDIIHIDNSMQNINDIIQTTNITVRQSRRTKKSPGDQTIFHVHVDKDTDMSQNGLPINDTDTERQSITNQQDMLTEFNEKDQSILSQCTDSELTLIDNNDEPLNTTVKQSRKTNNSPEVIRESMNGIEAKSFKTVRQSQRIQQSVSAISKEPIRKSHNPIRRPSVMIRHSSRLSQNTEIETDSFNISDVQNPIVLQPGKRWERSLSIYRRMTTMVDGSDISMLDVESLEHKGRRYRQSVITTMEIQGLNTSLHNESIKSRRSTFVSQPIRSTIRLTKDYNLSQTSIRSSTIIDDLQGFLSEDCDDTVVNLSKLSLGDPEVDVRILESFHDTSNRLSTARDYVLRRCNQTDALLFDECYPDTSLKNCRKIGEGVYGEVFLWRAGDGRARVLKVIPVAGDIVVNGEKQKDYHQIISEIVIAMELSALGTPIPDIESRFDEGKNTEFLDLHSVENATDVFNKVLAVRLVYGSYPSRLLDLWDLYDECKGSENDNPAILPSDQHYIVLELANAGQDLESYQFNNAEQAYALFQQVAFGLAVAEEAYQFEHRDLHWGNVLIAPTDQKYATFVLRGRARRVRTCGVRATVIDYSLSRVSLGARVLCCDLADDESLFDALGDYQFEVYRRMRDRLGNDWKNYDPHTNILWLHYTADKMITALRYTRTNTKIHKHYIAKLKDVKNRILCHGSACEYVITDNEI